jgi:hypothetical protein
MRQSGVSSSFRGLVLNRDGYHCVKCGRIKELEIHHIVPLVNGGREVVGNLITLCRFCHKDAPNEPLTFVLWMRSHLSPELERSKSVSILLFNLIIEKYELKDQISLEAHQEIEVFIADMYEQLWKVVVSKDIDELSVLLRMCKFQEEIIE